MKLFKELKRRNTNKYQNSEDYKFYEENKDYLLGVLSFYRISYTESPAFRLIQANILIRAMQNKEIYDETVQSCQEELLTIIDGRNEFIKNKVWKALDDAHAPYFEIDATRIYLPIYSRAMNLIYNDDCIKLFEYPYTEMVKDPRTSCIDLFDVYNYDVYASPFTSLIKIKEDKSSCAFYHPDFETIFIINDQGRLDIEIPIFDKYMKNPNRHHIINRVTQAVDDFYSNDRKRFIRSLRTNELISKKTYRVLMRKFSLQIFRKQKKATKGKTIDEIL